MCVIYFVPDDDYGLAGKNIVPHGHEFFSRHSSLHADFDRRYLEVTRELVRATPPDVHAPLLATLGVGERRVGAHMAMMDRPGSLASEAMSQVIGAVRALQHDQFLRQEQDAAGLRQIQYLLTGSCS
jgi:hypothetical protein